MEHYYSEQPGSRIRIREIEAFLRGNKLRFLTSSGVFSKQRIDPGTELLIEKAIINPDWTILDLGCGYGALGISLKKAYPSLRVVMTDINKRAVMLARRNAELNNVKVEIFQGDMFNSLPFEKPFFDSILLNPPMSAGRRICVGMIQQSFEWLKHDGLFQLVARHRKGGRTLMEYMYELFGNVDTLARKKGFHVYCSVKE